jgi:hypothetical protein
MSKPTDKSMEKARELWQWPQWKGGPPSNSEQITAMAQALDAAVAEYREALEKAVGNATVGDHFTQYCGGECMNEVPGKNTWKHSPDCPVIQFRALLGKP